VQQEQDVYTSKGVPVRVDGVAQIKVKGDDVSIATAAEQFLSKRTEEIKNIAMQTLEGHLRAILGTMTVEDIYQNRDAFASKVQEVAAGDMANMGLSIVSFTIRDIKDSQGYLDALGKPRIAQVKRDAQIAQAEADRDAMIRSSQATQAGQEAKFLADTKIAEAQRDYQSNMAQYQAVVNQKKAEADLAYDLQKYKTGQLVKAEEIQVTIVEKQKQIELSRSRSSCSNRKSCANSGNSKPTSKNPPTPSVTRSRHWPMLGNSNWKLKLPAPPPPPRPQVSQMPTSPKPPVSQKPKPTKLAVLLKPPSSKRKVKRPLKLCA
jgi:flotillin